MESPKESFPTPQEEIRWLEGQLEQKRKEMERSGETFRPQEHAKNVVESYTANPAPIAAAPLKPAGAQTAAQKLASEPHARQVNELLAIAHRSGILHAVSVARHLKNPHLLDDFHDRLVAELSGKPE